MNRGKIIGGISHEAENAYTAQGVRHVQFTVVARDSRGAESFWKCDAELDAATMDLLIAQGQRGTGIEVDYELTARPFMKSGVHVSDVKFLRVLGVAFPSRVAASQLERAHA